jgi:hypothetical protein
MNYGSLRLHILLVFVCNFLHAASYALAPSFLAGYTLQFDENETSPDINQYGISSKYFSSTNATGMEEGKSESVPYSYTKVSEDEATLVFTHSDGSTTTHNLTFTSPTVASGTWLETDGGQQISGKVEIVLTTHSLVDGSVFYISSEDEGVSLTLSLENGIASSSFSDPEEGIIKEHGLEYSYTQVSDSTFRITFRDKDTLNFDLSNGTGNLTDYDGNGNIDESGSWNFTFEQYTWEDYDDFSGSTLDTTKWGVQYLGGGIEPYVSDGKIILSGDAGNPNAANVVKTGWSDIFEGDDGGQSWIYAKDPDIVGMEAEFIIPGDASSMSGLQIGVASLTPFSYATVELNADPSSTSQYAQGFGFYQLVNESEIESFGSAKRDSIHRLSAILINGQINLLVDGEIKYTAEAGSFNTDMFWLHGYNNFNSQGLPFELDADNVLVLRRSMQSAPSQPSSITVFKDAAGKPTVVRNEGEYSWSDSLNGITLWAANLDESVMQKFEFFDDYVLQTETELREGIYPTVELNKTYVLDADGILIIGSESDTVAYNVIEAASDSISAKSAPDSAKSKHAEPELYEYEVALAGGVSAVLTINDGQANGELSDEFILKSNYGGIVNTFDDLSTLIDHIEAQDDNKSYPFHKWISLKNKRVLSSLRTYRSASHASHAFFADESSMKDFFEQNAFYRFSDGPISFSVPNAWTVDIQDDYFKWGEAASYLIIDPVSGLSTNLTIHHESFYENLVEWVSKQKSNYQENHPNSTFQNDDGDALDSSSDYNGTAIVHGYTDSSGLPIFNYSIGLNLNYDINSSWILAHLSDSYRLDESTYEIALLVSRSLSLDTSWAGPKNFHLDGETKPPREVVYPDWEARVPSSWKVLSSWYKSDWLGYYFQADKGSGWIFHAELGWLYSVPNHSLNSTWLYSPSLGWAWTSGEVFPFLFSNLSSNWLFFLEKAESYGYSDFYDYRSKRWRNSEDVFSKDEVKQKDKSIYEKMIEGKLDSLWEVK